MTISTSVLSQLARYLKSIGIDPELDLDGYPDGRIPVKEYMAIEEKAVAMTNDPCFGLHVGQLYTPGSWSIIDYIAMNSRTLGDALSLSGMYAKIVSGVVKPTVKPKPGEIEILLDVPARYPDISPHCYHTVLANMAQMVRKLTGRPISPIRVRCGNPEPPESVRAEFSAFFDCPVLFGSGIYSIVFHPSIRSIPLPQSDPNLLKYFQSLASDSMRQLEKKGGVTEEVVSLMVTRLSGKGASIRGIARELGMSVRSLQFRLNEEGTAFSDLLLQTRECLARRYLSQNATSEETAFLLGFSDSSSFSKAFKKWTGKTPGEYRRETR